MPLRLMLCISILYSSVKMNANARQGGRINAKKCMVVKKKVSSYQQLRFDRVSRLFEKYGQVCYYCTKPLSFDTVTIDHFIPLGRGGAHEEWNFRPSCSECNRVKGTKIFTETQVAELRSRAIRNSMTRKNQSTINDFYLEVVDRSEQIKKLKNVEIVLSEAWNKEKIEHRKTKKIARHLQEVLKIVMRKYGKDSIEQLLTIKEV